MALAHPLVTEVGKDLLYFGSLLNFAYLVSRADLTALEMFTAWCISSRYCYDLSNIYKIKQSLLISIPVLHQSFLSYYLSLSVLKFLCFSSFFVFLVSLFF